ncbi:MULTISPECIES: hypothetical protein [Halomicrobium]|uniref:DUF456 domain-containing protein n=2 Tax=Halomicrobium mukohataei TaxID=57705 RepID=C7P322_HALMD|nr:MULTISPECIES: hypothetical protein [Halomicrobium]ACV47494.1 conserved hypothetical protein [Halomicrobium mukohataei DSM 12286]QCD65958.1 hypothetical protein E5139_10025 [Halomicrobium mukohataei]QFR20763.1 hypothetical protein GBQ70_10020 [Halomicrobium sp. ZPS1]
MSERTDDLTIEEEAVDEVGVGETDASVDGTDEAGGLDGGFDTETDFGTESAETEVAEPATDTGGLRGRAADAFSVTSFALQLVGALVGTFVVGGALPLGPLSGVVGVLAVLFVLGVVSTEARYAEAGAAGVLVGVLTTVLGSITLSVVSGGLVPVAGGVAGGLAALVGHYAGRDLREGLTRDL